MKNIPFLLLLICLACNNKPTPVTFKSELSIEGKLAEQANNIKNKKITAINEILGDTISVANQVILLYGGSDCYTCVEEGYNVIKTIDSISHGLIKTNIISTSNYISSDQFRYNYKKYIFVDEHDIIRKELKYIYTPVILSFDLSTRVNVVHFPRKSDKNEDEHIFINNYLKIRGFIQKK